MNIKVRAFALSILIFGFGFYTGFNVLDMYPASDSFEGSWLRVGVCGLFFSLYASMIIKDFD